MRYYIIHNLAENRKNHMDESLKKSKINVEDVKWVLHPNKDEIDDRFILQHVSPGISYTCGIPVEAQKTLRKGLVSCTYKHYLALKDIVENNYEYAVIMEDNMLLGENVPDRLNLYIKQLNEMYPDWDIIFDNGWHPEPYKYNEGEIKDNIYVYPKSNEITQHCHGGTKCACFYLLRLKCAKKLYENYLPFNNAPDWWLNDLFRKLDIKSFWAEPSNVFFWSHISST